MLVVGFTCKTINLMLLLKKRAHLMQCFCIYMHTLTLAVMRKSSKYKKQKLTQLFVVLPYLYNLFNRILDLGYFPKAWSEGYILPLHKKGKLDDVNNFRGITLLSTLGKLFSRILNNRLTLWAEEYFVYTEAQAGFRAGMSTVDNVFVLHGIINHLLSKGENCFLRFCRLHQSF